MKILPKFNNNNKNHQAFHLNNQVFHLNNQVFLQRIKVINYKMKILILDVYPEKNYRISKDQNGAYGTANNYGSGLISLVLNLDNLVLILTISFFVLRFKAKAGAV